MLPEILKDNAVAAALVSWLAVIQVWQACLAGFTDSCCMVLID